MEDTGVDVSTDALTDGTDVDASDNADLSDSEPDVVETDTGDVTVDTGPDGLVILADLRTEARQNQTALGYLAARDRMYDFGGLDDDNGRIECVYTGRTVDTDGRRTPRDNCALIDGTDIDCAFNTEHIVPRKFLEDNVRPEEFFAAEGDLHHLIPSYERVNQVRDRFEFGETNCTLNGSCFFDEESQLGTVSTSTAPGECSGSSCVMDVRASRRGDVARSVFYISMRYDVRIKVATETFLKAWHLQDPPDAREMTRNAGIASVQGNRNPFIDDPELVSMIDDF